MNKGIEHVYDASTGVTFTREIDITPIPEPPVVVPTSVSMRQARLQLSILGLYQIVNQAVQSMSEAAQISWEYASTVDRSDTLTQQMIAMLGWTEEEADAYFIEANKL